MTFGGPAQKVGLLEGDVVMAVNGQNVENKCMDDVVKLVKEGGFSLSIRVMDKAGYDKWKKNAARKDAFDNEVKKRNLSFIIINHRFIQYTPSSSSVLFVFQQEDDTHEISSL